MNATPPRPPRFTCRLVRLWSTAGSSSRHAGSCEDCRQFFRAADRLDSALRRDAVRFAPPAPAGLELGIMQAIRAAAPTPAHSHSHIRWFVGGGIAAAAAVALALILLQPAPHSGSTAANSLSAPEYVATDESISNRLWNAVIPPAGTLVANNPLQQEIDAVYSDARSSLGFLALNFLPSGTTLPRAAQIGAKG